MSVEQADGRPKRRLAGCMLCVLVLSGCDVLGGSGSSGEINFRRGVAGVEFGDTRADVQAVLGPSDGGGIADGFWRNWHFSRYTTGPYAGLQVYYIEDLSDGDGPVDRFAIRAQYAGTTRKGIGVGSTRTAVRMAYGTPTVAYEGAAGPTDSTFVYCLARMRLPIRRVQIGFDEDRVGAIGMGYHRRLPEGDCG